MEYVRSENFELVISFVVSSLIINCIPLIRQLGLIYLHVITETIASIHKTLMVLLKTPSKKTRNYLFSLTTNAQRDINIHVYFFKNSIRFFLVRQTIYARSKINKRYSTYSLAMNHCCSEVQEIMNRKTNPQSSSPY